MNTLFHPPLFRYAKITLPWYFTPALEAMMPGTSSASFIMIWGPNDKTIFNCN